MEELCNEAKVEVKIATARAMAEDGLSTERIARILKISIEVAEKWISKSVHRSVRSGDHV